MADHVITLTAEQEKALPLREGRTATDVDGETVVLEAPETIAEFAQRQVVSVADNAIRQQRQRDFDALSDADKDAAILASKSK
jgi:hypothetical protein